MALARRRSARQKAPSTDVNGQGPAHFCRLPEEIMKLICDELLLEPAYNINSGRTAPTEADKLDCRRLAMTCRTWRAYLAPLVWEDVYLDQVMTASEAVLLGVALGGLSEYLRTIDARLCACDDEGYELVDVKLAPVAVIGAALRHLSGWRGLFICTLDAIDGAEMTNEALLQLGSLAELPQFVALSVAENETRATLSEDAFDSAFRFRNLTSLHLSACYFGNEETNQDCGLVDTLASTQLQMLRLTGCELFGAISCRVRAFSHLRYLHYSCDVMAYEDMVGNRLLEALLSRSAGTLTDLALGVNCSGSPRPDADVTARDFLAIAAVTKLKGIALSSDWAQERVLIALRHCRAEQILLDGWLQNIPPTLLEAPDGPGPHWPCLASICQSREPWLKDSPPVGQPTPRKQLWLLRDWNVRELAECEED